MVKRREDCELIKFFDWVSWQEKINPTYSLIYHIENERKCSQFAGKIRKQKGVRKGVPDVCVAVPRGEFHGMYVELKIKPNKLSPDQRAMMTLLHGQGYCVRVAWSGDELINLVKEYLK